MPVNKKLKTDPLQKRLNFSTSDNRAANEQTHESHDTVIEGSSTNDTDSKEVRHFQSRWLTLHPWLDYHDGKNLMFCKICMEHKMTNVFTTGTDNFRTSTISRHVASSDHKRALIAPMEQENLRKSVNKALNKEEKAVIVALKATYWLTKEGIPLSKYGSLIRLLKDLDVPDIEALDVNRHVDYSSYNTATDLLKSISNVINEGVTEKLRQSPCISILTDESTDIATHHKLCISARVVDPLTLQPSTCFLTDVRITDATGKGIYEAISSHLKDRGIPVTKVTGLGTDGASTMTGTKEGLTGQFLKVNPHLKNAHCAAHRLALCSEQAAQKIPAMQKFQQTLEMIFYHFKKSPNKMDKLEAVQKLLEEPSIKYREVHQVRWLSFMEALTAVYRTLDSLLSYASTSSEKDPKAAGLKKHVGKEMFISLTYAMLDILQPVMQLSLVFQKKDLDIGVVQVAIDDCKKRLNDMKDDINPLGRPTYQDQLKTDLIDGMFKEHHNVAKLSSASEFVNVRNRYIDALLDNISQRFPNTDFLTAFSVLGLRPITFLTEEELESWGDSSIDQLVDFYGQDQTHTFKNQTSKESETVTSRALVDPTAVKSEWKFLKRVVKVQQYPRSSMADIWRIICQYHADDVGNLKTLASMALTHPIHTADCERAFSSQNLVTTKLRCRLSGERIDELMRVMIEGPPAPLFDFNAALQKWRGEKSRKIFSL